MCIPTRRNCSGCTGPNWRLKLVPALSWPRSAARGERNAYVDALHASYLEWSRLPHSSAGAVTMGKVMATLRDLDDSDMIVTNGAGNYSAWVHRFHRFRRFGTQVALRRRGPWATDCRPRSRRKLRHPDRTVVCFAGDGCFQMTGQELATAVQYDAHVIVLVVDNGMYGTIRMHQERTFPGRVHATSLTNPDFAALARAYGAYGERVERDARLPRRVRAGPGSPRARGVAPRGRPGGDYTRPPRRYRNKP